MSKLLHLLMLLSLGLFLSCQASMGEGYGGGTYASNSSSFGHDRGNGGDHVRLKFVEKARAIVWMKQFKIIKAIGESGLDGIKAFLITENIKTTTEPLKDNRGNAVDAIGNPGEIILFVGDAGTTLGWSKIFDDEKLAEKMVLHELLRAAGIDDDSFVISEKVLQTSIVATKTDRIELPLTMQIFKTEEIKRGILLNEQASTQCGSASRHELMLPVQISCSEGNSCDVLDSMTGVRIKTLKLVETSTDEEKQMLEYLEKNVYRAIAICTSRRENFDDCNGNPKVIRQNECFVQPNEIMIDGRRASAAEQQQVMQQQQQQSTLEQSQQMRRL